MAVEQAAQSALECLDSESVLEFMSGQAANSGSVLTYVILREREIEKVLGMMMQAFPEERNHVNRCAFCRD